MHKEFDILVVWRLQFKYGADRNDSGEACQGPDEERPTGQDRCVEL